MIFDARKADLPDRIEADVAIIGSGAAGITLALELAAAGLQVVVVEAGGEAFDTAEQEFYRAEGIDPDSHGPVHMFRRRVLGGSTSVWGGRCIPFDPIDFEERPWIGYSRWPIGYEDVAPHYQRATEYAVSGPAIFNAGTALPGEQGPIVPGVTSPDVILDRIERFSHPTHFGKWYRDRLEQDPRIRVYIHAPVDRILTDHGGAVAAGLLVRLPDERTLTVAAARVIIAAGGLETPRLLLSSDQDRAGGLGNERDLVGRFYQCHIEGEIGRIAFHADRRDIRMDYERTADGIYVRRYIWLSPEAQRAKQLSGLVLRPNHANIVDPAHRHPVLSAMYIVKSQIVPEYARKLTSLEDVARKELGGSSVAFYAAHLRNIILGSPRLLAFSAHWTRRRILARRKLPSVVLDDPRSIYPLDVNGEQEPNPDSRVTLGEARDARGMRRIKIDWRTTAGDRQRLVDGLRVLQAALAGSGTVSLDFSGVDLEAEAARKIPVGGHHIGTARMAASPSEGVCDANCELFGTRGVYIAGAAAFTTSSFANPTLTLIALSLRLAEHIVQEVRGSRAIS